MAVKQILLPECLGQVLQVADVHHAPAAVKVDPGGIAKTILADEAGSDIF